MCRNPGHSYLVDLVDLVDLVHLGNLLDLGNLIVNQH